MFTGFTPDTSEFLWGLSFNNERSWFESHRDDYTRLLANPFKDLALDTDDVMHRRHPELDTQLHIARIYRDARRLHGRGPYKDHLWFSIKAWEGLLNGPMFWFEIGAADYSFGMGFYSATARQMEAYRKSIRSNPARLLRIADSIKACGLFELDGEEYKRPKGDVGSELNPWYNRKRIGLICTRDFGGELFDASLPERLADAFDILMPFYEYLMQVCPMEPEQDPNRL